MKEKRTKTENENEQIDNYYGESNIGPDVQPLEAINEPLVRRNQGKEGSK
jgi:hypothetical protein